MRSDEIMQKYFIENRSRLLDLAAYLDRIQRAEKPEIAFKDSRMLLLLKSIEELLSPEPKRTERIQTILSDQNLKPLDSIPMDKNAQGAPKECC